MGLFDSLFGSGSNTKTRALDRAAQTEGQYATDDRNRYLNLLNNGQQAYESSARAAVDAAMPSFNHELQQVRESAIRRGISTGDLAAGNEGDLAAQFQKQLADSIAGQGLNLYGAQLGGAGQLQNQSQNNWLDLLSGNADRAQAANNAGLNFWNSLLGAGGAITGGWLAGRGAK